MTRTNDRDSRYDGKRQKPTDRNDSDTVVDFLPLYGPNEDKTKIVLFEVIDGGCIMPDDEKERSDAWMQSDTWMEVPQ